MRGSMITLAMAFSVAACSGSGLGTEPSGDAPLQPGGNAARFEGQASCDGRQVTVEVELYDLAEATKIFLGEALVRITVDGELQVRVGPPRFRVGGAEVRVGAALQGDQLEVYAGLGEHCDWIEATRAR